MVARLPRRAGGGRRRPQSLRRAAGRAVAQHARLRQGFTRRRSALPFVAGRRSHVAGRMTKPPAPCDLRPVTHHWNARKNLVLYDRTYRRDRSLPLRPPLRYSPFRSSAGIAMLIVVPCPSSLSAQIAPPCVATICLAIASPSPAPPLPRARDRSAR